MSMTDLSGVEWKAAAGRALVYTVFLSADLHAHMISKCHLWLDMQLD